MKTHNRVLLITGATGGIGTATCLLAAEKSYDIAVHYHNNDAKASKLVETLLSKGAKAISVKANLCNEKDIVRMYEKIDAALGPLTDLVNNAGTLFSASRLDHMDAARIKEVLELNALGPMLCSKHAILRMSPRYDGKGGNIVNISSRASQLGSPNEYVDYAASKGALDSLTVGLSLELAEENIRVNAVRPGFIYTDIHAKSGDKNRVEKIKHKIPMKRGGEASEVANAILWLLSDQSSFCTGSFIDVSGGK
ncbi:SDR family oxidoreductase [Fangia hongkongensis]|uniref:SDR family oxidoreductase n=1 Tax=Fangia hongkongensis TaxID=270495 RepID=UPI000377F5D1|nr:SDR family oxidoreductase [Fangia hongkongensis]MBK2125422.1 SDR family oxidoreductase [Fangia hongkongensis]